MLPIDQDDNGNLIYEGEVEPYVIRTSERTNFKKCRTLWDFTSQLRRNLESTKMNKHLSFGIAIHVGAEHYYSPDNWHLDRTLRVNAMVSAFTDELTRQQRAEEKATGGLDFERQQLYAEQEELGVGMLIHYDEWAYERDMELGLKPIAVEYKFQVPIYDEGEPLVIDGRPVVYQVRVDMLAEHGDGTLWIWDHKTAGNITGSVDFLDLDVQLSSYPWAFQTRFGKPVAGVMYNELEKVVPHPPKINKNGSISQDKKQLTTYAMYQETISDLGLDPSPYEAMLEYLRDNPRDYFRRTSVKRNQRELVVQGQFVVDEARDMLSTPSIYPNPGKFNCGGCDFRGPCGVRTEGGDFEFLLQDPMMYRTRPTQDDIDANTV